jgi:hypothetical protein
VFGVVCGAQLTVLEIGVPKDQAFSIQTNVQLGEKDFPVSMIPDNKHGSLFLLSKDGWLCLYEIQSGKCIYSKQASAVRPLPVPLSPLPSLPSPLDLSDLWCCCVAVVLVVGVQATMFASCEHLDGGVVAVDQSGRVSHFAIDRKAIVPFIVQQMQDLELGIQMAKRYDLEGAGVYFKQQFDRLMQTQRFQEAMELAASSPQVCASSPFGLVFCFLFLFLSLSLFFVLLTFLFSNFCLFDCFVCVCRAFCARSRPSTR